MDANQEMQMEVLRIEARGKGLAPCDYVQHRNDYQEKRRFCGSLHRRIRLDNPGYTQYIHGEYGARGGKRF